MFYKYNYKIYQFQIIYMITFKEFLKEEMNTGEVPLTQKGPYRNSGFKNPIVMRRKRKPQITFEEFLNRMKSVLL